MMAKEGELFSDERHPWVDGAPGTVGNDEDLERRLPGAGSFGEGDVPADAFTRGHLTWKEEEGGASVHRSAYVQSSVGGRRGRRGTIRARAGDIRMQVDADGDRKWHVVASPQEDDPSHAEIYRDPPGKRPTGREREDFLALWKTTEEQLRSCRMEMPDGRGTVAAGGDGGVRLQWQAKSGPVIPIGQVESIREAVNALIRAEVIPESDAQAEQRRLESEWARQLAARNSDSSLKCS